MKKNEKLAYDGYIKIKSAEVDLGHTTKTMEKVEHPDSVSVLLINESNDTVILVRQYRYPVNKKTTEVVAGKIEEGESPISAAIREVLEETGYVVEEKKIGLLGSFWKSPGYTSEVSHLFVAVVEGLPTEKSIEEGIELIEIPLKEFGEPKEDIEIDCITTSHFRWFIRSTIILPTAFMESLLDEFTEGIESMAIPQFTGQSGEA